MRSFTVTPGVVPTWPGITPAGRVVARFLSLVRTTGDAAAARVLMAPVVPGHQVVADDPRTVERTPEEYAAHVQDMLAAYGRFRFEVTGLVAERDHVYVRWQQHGHDLAPGPGGVASGAPVTEVGSAVYRVAHGRIAEYWVQLDRLGLLAQLAQGGSPAR